MAEVRKHRPGSGQGPIAQALEAALGAAARPVTPGAPPEPRTTSKTPTPGAAAITAMPGTGAGWTTLSPEAALAAQKAARAQSDADEDDDLGGQPYS